MNTATLPASADPFAALPGGLPALVALLVLLAALGALAALRAAAARGREAREARDRALALEERLGQVAVAQAEAARASAEMAGRVQAMGEGLAARQGELARMVHERLDVVRTGVGETLDAGAKATQETLARLGERLAVIDAAQAGIAGLAGEMVGLKDVLSNKQARGAFGQGRMEAIVKDGLAARFYKFQHTLSNNAKPDCVICVPGDERHLAVDAKFPLEAFQALRAAGEDAAARKQAEARVRADMGRHVKDVSSKYLIPGETQDLVLLFIPSEGLWADIAERFDDVVQNAHRARVVIVSPALFTMAIQVMQGLGRDATMREQAGLIQQEVGKLMQDVARLRDRAGKLDQHIRQAGDDAREVLISADKVLKRGHRVSSAEGLVVAGEDADAVARAIAAPAPPARGEQGRAGLF